MNLQGPFRLTYTDGDGAQSIRQISDLQACSTNESFSAMCHLRGAEREFKYQRIDALVFEETGEILAAPAVFRLLNGGAEPPASLALRFALKDAEPLAVVLLSITRKLRGGIDAKRKLQIVAAVRARMGRNVADEGRLYDWLTTGLPMRLIQRPVNEVIGALDPESLSLAKQYAKLVAGSNPERQTAVLEIFRSKI